MLSMTVDTRQVDALWQRFPAETTKAVRSGIADGLAGHIARWKVEKMRGRPGLNAPRGEAGLRGSAKFEVFGERLAELEGFAFFAGTGNAYARIQEFGGTVRARRVSFLTIPVLKSFPGKSHDAPRIRDYPGGRFIPTAKGFVYVLGGRVLFVLVKSVLIPPRMGWRVTWDQHGPDLIAKRIGQHLGRMIERLNAGRAA